MESGADFSYQMDYHRIYYHENEKENFEEKKELQTNISTIPIFGSVINLETSIIGVVLIWLSGQGRGSWIRG